MVSPHGSRVVVTEHDALTFFGCVRHVTALNDTETEECAVIDPLYGGSIERVRSMAALEFIRNARIPPGTERMAVNDEWGVTPGMFVSLQERKEWPCRVCSTLLFCATLRPRNASTSNCAVEASEGLLCDAYSKKTMPRLACCFVHNLRHRLEHQPLTVHATAPSREGVSFRSSGGKW